MNATTTRSRAALWEPSAWLRGQLATLRSAAIKNGLNPDDGPMIVCPLNGTGYRPGSREDRTCDRCGTYVSAGTDLMMLTVPVARRMVAAGGLCTRCADVEAVIS